MTLDDGDRTALAVVVAVQLRPDDDKRYSWPVYVTTLFKRHQCPVVLLVVCPSVRVATWCGEPIPFGPPGSVVTPVALGPDQVPIITDPDAARRSPELAVLSALAHGGEPDAEPMLDAMLTGLQDLEPDLAKLYADLVLQVLPEAAKAYLEKLMTTMSHRYQSDFARRYYSEGETNSKSADILTVLAARGIEVAEGRRAEIAECTDLEQLTAWLLRAATASRIEDLDG